MKIAQICPRLVFPGGTERFVVEVNRALNELGVQSEIFRSRVNLSPDHLSDLAISARLAAKAIRNGFDALVFHQGQEAARFFRKAITIPYFHGPKYDYLMDRSTLGQVYGKFLSRLIRNFGHVVCNSEYTASRLRRTLPENDVRVVYPGIRTGHIIQLPHNEDCFFYYHSRIHPQKNQDFLLEVFEGLPYKLHLSGGTWDRALGKYHRQIAQRASMMRNVKLRTNISEEEKISLFSQCSVFLFPAKKEPFGISLLEAMTFGKPIIALNSGASSELLGDAGILCGLSVSSWQDAITNLLSNAALRHFLSQKSVVRAREFSWETTARELVSVIECA